MFFKKSALLALLFFLQSESFLQAQEKHYFQTDFSISEFEARRDKIFDEIGENSIALIQSASSVAGFKVFRQTNTFFYLCGLEEGHAYLLLNGKNRSSTIYLPHREEARERNQGKILSANDADLVKELTGVTSVLPIESLGNDLIRTGLINGKSPILFTPPSPRDCIYQSPSFTMYRVRLGSCNLLPLSHSHHTRVAPAGVAFRLPIVLLLRGFFGSRHPRDALV